MEYMPGGSLLMNIDRGGMPASGALATEPLPEALARMYFR
jgi:hypothetical protein